MRHSWKGNKGSIPLDYNGTWIRSSPESYPTSWNYFKNRQYPEIEKPFSMGPKSINSNCNTTIVIPKFESYKVGSPHKTSYFYIGDKKHCFHLEVYPHGFNNRVGEYVSLWIKKYTQDEMLLEFTCSVLDSHNVAIHEKTLQQHLSLESCMGWITFCRRNVILDENNKALNKGSLTLECRVTVYEKSAIPNPETEHCDPFFINCLSKLSNDIKSLLSSGLMSDFTLRVGEKEFSVHKSVLSARSEAFKKLILHNKELTICSKSPETIGKFLEYLYSGYVGNLTVKSALDLYDVSVTYEVVLLKTICSDFLKNNLGIESIFGVLLCASSHSDKELLDACLYCMNKNLRLIKGSVDWIQLMKTNPDLANRAIFYQENK